MKKFISCIIALCLLMTMLPAMVWAAESTLNIANGSITISDSGWTQGSSSGSEVDVTITGTSTANTITVTGGNPTITLKDVNLSGNKSMIAVQADAKILLAGANTVKSTGAKLPAITISSNKTLTIDGTGSLTATGTSNSGGIGGAGNVVIDGGNITADSHGTGAAIGGHDVLGGFGNITINGGIITANGDYSGICTSTTLSGGGGITITGGEVNITVDQGRAYDGYAALGGGRAGTGAHTPINGDVTISGGKITITLSSPYTYAIRTDNTFSMSGGTLAQITRASGSTFDYITAGSVSITGGNVNSYYNKAIPGRMLTKLNAKDPSGAVTANTEIAITVENGGNSREWSAITANNGVITTYLAADDAVFVNGAPGTRNDDGSWDITTGLVGIRGNAEKTTGTLSTSIKYVAETTEQWTLTVPEKLEPGNSDTVEVQGKWPLDRKLTVTTDDTVTMSNTGSPDKTLAVTFAAFELVGSNVAAVNKTESIAVADWEENGANAAPLFGTWTGTITYTVELGAVS